MALRRASSELFNAEDAGDAEVFGASPSEVGLGDSTTFTTGGTEVHGGTAFSSAVSCREVEVVSVDLLSWE